MDIQQAWTVSTIRVYQPRTLMHSLRTLLAALLVVATTVVVSTGPGQAQEPIQISEFYDQLEPYGRWVDHPQYGSVWAPDTDPEWRPYTRGRWVFTDEHGWLWQSEEAFGWAVYHYGRWFLDEDLGWLWVPGSEWGPAWVAWRHSDSHVGWVPLPPEAEWHNDALTFSSTYYDRPHLSPAWVFVPVAALTTYAIYRYILPPRRNTVFLRSTTWVPRSHHHGRHGVFNAGFDRRRYETITRRPITPVRIVVSNRPQVSGARAGAPGGSVQVFRPRVVGTVAATPPPRIVPRAEFQSRSLGAGQRPQRVAPGNQPSIQPRPDPNAGRVIQPQPSQPQVVQPPGGAGGGGFRARNLESQPPGGQGQPSITQPRTITPAQPAPLQPRTVTPAPSGNPQPGTFLPPSNRAAPPPVPQRAAPPPPQAQPRILPPPAQSSGEPRVRGPSGPPPGAAPQSGPPRAANPPPAQNPQQKPPEKKKRTPDGKEG